MDLVVKYPSRTVFITRSQGPIAVSFWVNVAGTVVKVRPRENDIDALKVAVKAEMKSQEPGFQISALRMQVKKHDGTVCDKMSAPLEANTAKTAYIVTLTS
jgi:hypothetical protein